MSGVRGLQTNLNFLAKRKCQAHFQCERGERREGGGKTTCPKLREGVELCVIADGQ